MDEAITPDPGAGGGEEENPCDFEQDPACGPLACDESPGCADEDLGCSLPVQFTLDLDEGLQDFAAGSCVDSGSALFDYAWEWTAPVAGTFQIRHSTGWLSVQRGACDGPELACNENHGGPLDLVEVTLAEGETIVIIASAVIERHFDLSITRVAVETTLCANGLDDDGDGAADCADPDCTPVADQDLGSAFPVTASATTAGAGDDVWGASCRTEWSTGGRDREDVAFRWTAPAAGRYLLQTTGSQAMTLVRVLEAACPGEELACDLPFDPPGEQSPWGHAIVELAAGQSVVIVVDAEADSGDVVLTIDEAATIETACADDRDDDGDGGPDCADPDCAGDAACSGTPCLDRDLGSAFPIDVTGTIAGNDAGANACGDGAFGPDTGFLWTAPADGTYLVSVTASTFRPAFSVRDRGCGSELRCGYTSCDEGCPEEGVPITVTERVAIAGGQTVGIVVEGTEGAAFRLAISRVDREQSCQDGLDDDADGARDCHDGDCAAARECQEELSCTDGIDQDVDGAVDCADADCLAVVDHDLRGQFPVSVAGDTRGLASDYQITACTEDGVNVKPDEAWRWSAPAAGTYQFALAGAPENTVISVRDPGCGTVELTCSEFSGRSLTMTAGQEVIVVVHPFNVSSVAGPYSLTITSSTRSPRALRAPANVSPPRPPASARWPMPGILGA
jgi:hypothetical protein